MAAQSVFDMFAIARGGYALVEANKELKDLIRAIKETGKAGEISLVLKITPDKNDARIVTLDPDYKIKKPRKKFASGHAFVGDDYSLSKEDPAQLDLLEERRAAGIATLHENEQLMTQVGRGGS
jgi:hypothetical protein